MGISVRSLFCFAVFCVYSSFAIILLGKSDLVAFCVLKVMSLLSLFDPLDGLQYVIVALLGHTHLLLGLWPCHFLVILTYFLANCSRERRAGCFV